MSLAKKVLLLTLLIAFALPVLSFATAVDEYEDEKDDYKWKTWRTRRSHAGFSGHGAFYLTYQPVEFKDLKDIAREMGIEIPEDGLFGMGGYGMGHIGKGWRIGGGGHGYEGRYTGVYYDELNSDKQYNRVMEIEMGGGGFIIEYSPWMFGPVNLAVGTMIGGGGVTIRMIQDDGTFTWKNLTDQYTNPPSDHSYPKDNIVTEVKTEYFLLNPYISARFHILDWMALEGTVAYNWNTISSSDWSFGEREIAGNGPELDNKKIYYRLNFVFGG